MTHSVIRRGLTFSPLATVFFLAISSSNLQAQEIPPGYHMMPDGRIMANNPATAIVPAGYYLRSNGVLIKLEEQGEAKPQAVVQQNSDGDLPPGFHRMPDGRIMANNPATAVAPSGYHLMPDGTLMSNSGGAHAHHHHHGAGSWMFEYRYMRMNMSDMLDTTTVVTAEDVLAAPYSYMMSPTDMIMDMHMFMGMYGVTDNVTAMVMLHYLFNSMGMKASDGTESTMSSNGIGDTILSLSYNTPYKVTVELGGNVPTGSIQQTGDMNMGASMGTMTGVRLPYGMQLGSGSYELKPSVAYKDRIGSFGFGSKLGYTYRLADNYEGYRLGNKTEFSTWLEWFAHKYASVNGQVSFMHQGQIKGSDSQIATQMDHDGMQMRSSPAADPTLYGGMRLDGTIGLKVNTADRMYGLKTDITFPVYQNLWGPQMRTTWIASLGLEAMF